MLGGLGYGAHFQPMGLQLPLGFSELHHEMLHPGVLLSGRALAPPARGPGFHPRSPKSLQGVPPWFSTQESSARWHYATALEKDVSGQLLGKRPAGRSSFNTWTASGERGVDAGSEDRKEHAVCPSPL